MDTQKKPLYKHLLFWEILLGALLILGIVIYIAVELGKPLPDSSQNNPPVVDENPADEDEPNQQEDPTDSNAPEPNPIGLTDFETKNGYLSCLTTPSVLGIDVSYWQGNIDWQQVKKAGIDFAMIRVAWRGSEEGIIATDDYVQINYNGATNAGIKVGAYFFSQAISVEEAIEEAEYLLDIIKDWNVEMPVVYDWEFVSLGSRTGKVDARTLTDCVKAFCDTVAAAGYDPMVYFGADHSFNGIYLEELTDYKFWLAQYNTVLNYPYKIDMWQYTETGSVPGISGNVDINLYFPWEAD